MSLPIEIEEKLEQLPTIPFSESEELQNVLSSAEFTDIFEYYKEHYLTEDFLSKPILYQKLGLYLKITNQDESLLEHTDQVLYRRPVPTVEEFLYDNFYHGRLTATMYPYWREQMADVFRQGSPIRKVILGGCIGCLTGDTVVDTLNGGKTMEELSKDFNNTWVLSFNTKNKSWEPDKIVDAFSTGIKDIYEITLDNGENIKCTSNHLFLTRNNKWLSLDTGLDIGQSMMPYYTRLSKTGYVQVKDNVTEKFENRYKIVGRWKSKLRQKIAIHHKDYNKLNDNPNNLCLLDVKAHFNFHAKKGAERWREYNASIRGDEFKELRSAKTRKGRKTIERSANFKEWEENRKRGLYSTLQDSEHQRNAALAAWKNRPEHMLQCAIQSIVTYNKSEKGRNESRKRAEHMRKLRANKTPEEKEIIKLKCMLPTYKRKKGEDSKEYLECLNKIRQHEPWYDPKLGAKKNHELKKQYNHKITSIRYVGREEVYDITTEKNHNFALKAGIIAHNSGKSTVSRKFFVYVLYRIFCLRYPRAVFNIDQDTTIANFILAITLKQVYDTNLIPFVKLLEGMPCFQRVQSVRSFDNFNLDNPKCPIPFMIEKSTATIFFPDNIILCAGSRQQHTTGYSIVNSFVDELNEKGSTEAISLLNSIDNRFSSRFEGSDFVFQSVVSSARTENSAMGEYLKTIPTDSSAVKTFNPMLWEVKPDPNFVGDGTTFPVMVGNGSIPSMIFTDPGDLLAIEEKKYVVPAGCTIIDVPTVYRSKFELQLDQSIQDIAGMTTSDNNMVFRDLSLLEEKNLTPEIYLEVNIKDDIEIFNNPAIQDLFEYQLNGEMRLKKLPLANRYVHIDLAGGGEGNCDAALCMLHKEYVINETTGEKDTIYVNDLMLSINAKNQIDLHAIQKFTFDLVTLGKVRLHTISADQWQSLVMLQAWEKSGYFTNVKKLSVDSKLEPYTNAARLIELGQVKIGICPKLKKELAALVLIKGKVTKVSELKDMPDALVGALYNAQMDYGNPPIDKYTVNTKRTANDINNILQEDEEFVDLF